MSILKWSANADEIAKLPLFSSGSSLDFPLVLRVKNTTQNTLYSMDRLHTSSITVEYIEPLEDEKVYADFLTAIDQLNIDYNIGAFKRVFIGISVI